MNEAPRRTNERVTNMRAPSMASPLAPVLPAQADYPRSRRLRLDGQQRFAVLDRRPLTAASVGHSPGRGSLQRFGRLPVAAGGFPTDRWEPLHVFWAADQGSAASSRRARSSSQKSP